MEGRRLVVNEKCVEATVCPFLFAYEPSLLTLNSQHGRLHLEVEDAEFFTDRDSK